MKKFIWYLVALIIITLALVLPGKLGYVSDHPTLNQRAEEPDIHIKNVWHYMRTEEMERSVFHLQKAIASIKAIESDADLESVEGLDRAIVELERVNDELSKDSINLSMIYRAFDYTLNNLAHAELEVSEMYAETNQEDRSKLAMRYAQMHVRNALLFQQAVYEPNSEHVKIEQHVFQELDSLISSERLSSAELTLKIDHIIKEVDELLAKR